jgi:hypothetical protein
MRRSSIRFLLGVCALALLAPTTAVAKPPVAHAAPMPPLQLLSPANWRAFGHPHGITFRVQGQPNEAAGSLHIELGTDNGEELEFKKNGLYDPNWSLVGRWRLEQVEPGGDIYKVRIAKKRFLPDAYHQQQVWYWHAYRTLPEGSCNPDCYQVTRERGFTIDDPWPYLADEPENNTRSGSSPLEFVSLGQGFLETRQDRDYYRFRTEAFGREVRPFRLDFDNDGCNEHCSGDIPDGEYGAMVVALFRRHSDRPIFKQRIRVGQFEIFRAEVRRDRRYVLLVRHAYSGDGRAAKNLEYGYWPNNGKGWAH